MLTEVIVALLSFAGTVVGSFFANRKNAALVAYRLEQLENKVQAHNNLIERMYKVEDQINLHEEKIKVANHRIDDLEKERSEHE